MKKMRAEIFKSKDEYLEEIFKYLKIYFNLPKEEWDWKTFFAGLENLIFESLEKTYSITAKKEKFQQKNQKNYLRIIQIVNVRLFIILKKRC